MTLVASMRFFASRDREIAVVRCIVVAFLYVFAAAPISVAAETIGAGFKAAASTPDRLVCGKKLKSCFTLASMPEPLKSERGCSLWSGAE